MNSSLVIGLSAVVVAIKDGEAAALTVRHKAASGNLTGLPFGPFDPDGHRTFELALRAFVTEQTRFDLGYVEQLYTFGDKGRDAPLADLGDGDAAARVISIGYLALAPAAVDTHFAGSTWRPWSSGTPPPTRPVLPPCGTSVTPAAAQALTTAATSAVEPGRTTARARPCQRLRQSRS